PMYQRILVALDHTAGDETLLSHVTQLARLTGAALLLVHVTERWAAQCGDQCTLAESRHAQEDRDYLDGVVARLGSQGLSVDSRLASGDPSRNILKVARAEGCDLIAMTTHGHRFIYDVLIGSTIDRVRHATDIPLLIVRAPLQKGPGQT